MKNLPQVLHQQLKIKFLYIFYIFLLIKVYFLFSIAMDLKQQLFAQARENQIAFDLIFIFFYLNHYLEIFLVCCNGFSCLVPKEL